MRLVLLFTAFVFSLSSWAQSSYSGRVIDESTKQSLAFVNILLDGGASRKGTSTDIDGRFTIPSNQSFDSLQFSYLGYGTLVVHKSDLPKDGKINLKRSGYKIEEVVIVPGENPAHRIINKVIENRKINNPERATEFSYESYNKLIFTTEVDSSLIDNPEAIAKLDSSEQEFYEFMNNQHFMMMESVTKRNFIPPDNSSEKVIASRISGLKNPVFTLIGTQMQSFSLYDNYFKLLDINYLSPISKGSTSKYLFVLEDTIYQDKDSVFVISFRPRKGKNFDGLKGVLYVNTNQFAVQNVIAEPMEVDEEGIGMKIRQKYGFLYGKQWFPVQLNTDLKMFGASIEIDSISQPMLGIGTSYIKNVQLKSDLEKKEIGNIILEIEPDAGKKDEAFWEQYRVDTLSAKEQETYHFMDSIGEKYKFDEKMKLVTALITNELPIGPVSLVLNRIVRFNGYEGLRLGMGARTNDRISKWVSVGGYFGYGFKDKAGKYGGDLSFYLNQTRDSKLQFLYENDVVERGGVHFYDSRRANFSTEIYRDFYMNRMEESEKVEANLSFRWLDHFQLTLFTRQEERQVTNDYSYLNPISDQVSIVATNYQFFESGVNVRFAYKEKLVEMFGRRIPVGSRYPIVYFKYTRGEDGVLDGDYSYDRVDFQLDKRFVIKNLGETSVRVMGGYVEGDVPATILYRGRGVFQDGYSLSAANSFETMAPNEFFSNQYVNVFFRHDFKSLLYKSKHFNPQLGITTAFAIGELENPLRHRQLFAKSLEAGFMESGIMLNNLINLNGIGFGVGVFYRYGANALEKTEDNIAIKASFDFAF